jgi:heat shock protein HslJ
VGENVLFHLDIDGKQIEGDLASKYKLLKVETSKLVAPTSKEGLKTNETNKAELKNSKWRLVKLNGMPVEKTKDNKRDFGISFNVDGRFSAFAGCNNMAGNYELKEDINRIKFSKIASTMMACNDMAIEQEFAKVLETVDNYNFDEKTLKLNKAKMSPLAEFEIIE